MRYESTIILFSIAFLTATLKMFVVSFHPFKLNKYQFCTHTESRGRRRTMETNSNHPADLWCFHLIEWGWENIPLLYTAWDLQERRPPSPSLGGLCQGSLVSTSEACRGIHPAVHAAVPPSLWPKEQQRLLSHASTLCLQPKAWKVPANSSLDKDPHHAYFKWKLCELGLCGSSGWRFTRAHESLAEEFWESDRAVPIEACP